ncbi:MAG: hypothetical protein R2733_15105 [Acidimicrobiales bacterium]
MTTPSDPRPMLPGWYLREDMPSRERFWNGSMWTDLERDAPLLSEFLGPIEPTIRALLDSYERAMAGPSVLSRVASHQRRETATIEL